MRRLSGHSKLSRKTVGELQPRTAPNVHASVQWMARGETDAAPVLVRYHHQLSVPLARGDEVDRRPTEQLDHRDLGRLRIAPDDDADLAELYLPALKPGKVELDRGEPGPSMDQGDRRRLHHRTLLEKHDLHASRGGAAAPHEHSHRVEVLGPVVERQGEDLVVHTPEGEDHRRFAVGLALRSDVELGERNETRSGGVDPPGSQSLLGGFEAGDHDRQFVGVRRIGDEGKALVSRGDGRIGRLGISTTSGERSQRGQQEQGDRSSLVESY